MARQFIYHMQGLTKTYTGGKKVLDNVHLQFYPDAKIGVLGPNGAGKTTTLKSIMQLVKPSSGSVHFLGNDITKLPTHRVAKMGLGYVPEERRIFTDLTILENLEVGRQAPREGLIEWTTDILFDLFPNLKERRNNRGKELSGGEQQMLTIARTLMGNPKLLLLDEPSEGIAPVIVEQMAETIVKLKKESLPVLISEQNLHFARMVADRAIIIESGSGKFDGTFEQLESRPEIRDAYLSV